MENKKVEIISQDEGSVSLIVSELHLKREFPRKGSKVTLDLDTLREALYFEGVEYLFKEGILYIPDMEAKQALGLEPEDAEEPENIIVLTEEEQKRALTTMPVFEFKPLIEKLGYEQSLLLVDYAVKNEIVDMEKCDLLKKKTNKDIMRMVQIERANKEEDTKEE